MRACDAGTMPDDPRQEYAPRPAPDTNASGRPFSRSVYVFGWLAICLVAGEGINSMVTGLYGTGIILVCLVPVMIWLMYTRRQKEAAMRRRG